MFFQKNAKGELMSVPLSTAGAFWGYRTDLVDKPIESIEQLLEPRFKGKLCVPFPVNLTGLLMLTLAMQRGGNERNIEPGWQFLKELAERGQIGRVINNNSEFINAMSSGETSVAFFNIGAWTQVRKQFPVKIMSKIKDNKGFLFNEGFAVIKQSDPKKVAAAKRLANHFATPEINEQYNWPLGEGPTNPKAKANPDIADVFYTPDELGQYAYIADFEYMSSQVDSLGQALGAGDRAADPPLLIRSGSGAGSCGNHDCQRSSGRCLRPGAILLGVLLVAPIALMAVRELPPLRRGTRRSRRGLDAAQLHRTDRACLRVLFL